MDVEFICRVLASLRIVVLFLFGSPKMARNFVSKSLYRPKTRWVSSSWLFELFSKKSCSSGSVYAKVSPIMFAMASYTLLESNDRLCW